MIVRSLDADGDWQFGKGRNDYLVNNAAIVQSISTRLKSFLGDCFFAMDAGLDWFNLLGSKNQLALELAIRTVIINTEGVTRLVDVSSNLDHTVRHLSMRIVVETVYTALNNTGPVTSTITLLLTEDGDFLTTEDGSPLAAG